MTAKQNGARPEQGRGAVEEKKVDRRDSLANGDGKKAETSPWKTPKALRAYYQRIGAEEVSPRRAVIWVDPDDHYKRAHQN